MAKLVLSLLLIAVTYVAADRHHYSNCPKLYNPSYGYVTTGNTVARYYCNKGYGMYSNRYGLYPRGSYYQRSCVSGHWAGKTPRCVLYRKYCKKYNRGAHMYEHPNYYYGHSGYPGDYGYGRNYPYQGNYPYGRNYRYRTGSYRNNYPSHSGNYPPQSGNYYTDNYRHNTNYDG